MIHEAYERIVPGADTAVLMIHGICGSPNHFRQLLPMEAEIPQHWSVCNMVLDGHCASVGDFSRSSMAKWKSQVRRKFDALCAQHSRVILVAHSLGTLFSYDLALRRPEKIGGMFLLASPVCIGLRPGFVPMLLRLVWGKPENWTPQIQGMYDATGIDLTGRIWKYISWIPRMLELFRESKAARKKVQRLRVRCVAYQSYLDEVVSRRSGKLLEESGKVEVHTLMDSTHYYYAPQDQELLMGDFRQFLQDFLDNPPVEE